MGNVADWIRHCVILFLLTFCVETHSMTSDQALLCVEAWAKAKGRSSALKTINVQPNGDFNLEVGSAGFRFVQKEGALLVSGYVASGQIDLVNPIAGQQAWNWLLSIASLQPATLGDGQLELYTGPADPRSKKPAVYLTKTFLVPTAKSEQFVQEVAWLVRWATYWRDERWNQVFSSRTDDQLKAEAAEAQAWASKTHPRPW